MVNFWIFTTPVMDYIIIRGHYLELLDSWIFETLLNWYFINLRCKGDVMYAQLAFRTLYYTITLPFPYTLPCILYACFHCVHTLQYTIYTVYYYKGHSTKQLDYDLFIVLPQQLNTTLHFPFRFSCRSISSNNGKYLFMMKIMKTKVWC